METNKEQPKEVNPVEGKSYGFLGYIALLIGFVALLMLISYGIKHFMN